MAVHTGEKRYSYNKCGISYTQNSGMNKHKKKCNGQWSSQQNETTSTSEIEFVDCGVTIKQGIKDESDIGDEVNTLYDPLIVNSEHCQDIVSSEISLESELEAESIVCKETIKLEIKQELQETEDLQDPISAEVIEEDLQDSTSIDEICIEQFKIKNYD